MTDKRKRASREKGKKGQSAIARRWRNAGLFPEAYSTQGHQTKRAGEAPGDIGGVPFVVEVKKGQRVRMRDALEQAEEASARTGDTRPCVAVCHRDGATQDEAIVLMRYRDWRELGDPEDESIVCMRLVDWEDLVRSGVHSRFAALAHEEVGPMFLTTERLGEGARRGAAQSAQAYETRRAEALKQALDVGAALQLEAFMVDLSEDFHCAGWLVGLGRELWEMVAGGSREWGFGTVSEEQVARLAYLHQQCGGWWSWAGKGLGSGPLFVTADQWLRRYEEGES